ncbi:hypothetical protein C8Q72DRAFT_486416 [Fomitopsis betulina]|nr:hypothetical protein C8Q72DRAFT_486416 [Fomitopsis betulina]
MLLFLGFFPLLCWTVRDCSPVRVFYSSCVPKSEVGENTQDHQGPVQASRTRWEDLFSVSFHSGLVLAAIHYEPPCKLVIWGVYSI